MAESRLSVEGPEFTKLVRETEAIVRHLESNKWDFATAPRAFARSASADVVGKEIATIFDGERLTRIGRLVMGGTGQQFNLMGPIPALSELRATDSKLLNAVGDAMGSRGLREFPEFKRFGKPQKVDFFNYTTFFQLRDLVFWSVLHGSGCFPSTLEHMARHFAQGQVVQNVMYRPSRLPGVAPVFMQAACLSYSYPSRGIEWMDKPLYGGFATETLHVEYLLTPKPTKASHPYLPIVDEGAMEYAGQRFYVRHFRGVAPKDGLRGKDVPPEGQQAQA